MPTNRVSRALRSVSLITAMFLSCAFAVPAQTYKVLYAFQGGSDAQWPYAGIIRDSAGNLYGTTAYGGDQACTMGCGTVFKLAQDSEGNWSETILHSFAGGSDGSMPDGEMVMDSAGNLYGTTDWGGISGWMGVLFKLTPEPDGTWSFTIVHSFGGQDGTGPIGSLSFDANGNLYGTTWLGGNLSACNNGCGTVYQLKPNSDGSWSESVIYSFGGGSDGQAPQAGVAFDAAGNLYGTTTNGGDMTSCRGGCGTVFQLRPNSDGSWTHTIAHTFRGAAGNWPFSPVTVDATGNIYGTTQNSGGNENGQGTVFSLAPQGAGWKYGVIHAFTGGWDGGQPGSGKLASDPKGNLYGTTQVGGAHGAGVAFKLVRGANGRWREQILYDFNGNDGGWPYPSVILDKRGNLYGANTWGGAYGAGVIFEITP